MADLRKSAGVLAVLALLFALAFWPTEARANVSCSANGAISFGTSQTATGTISYDCTNFGASTVNFTLCSALGPASFPGTNAQPIMTSSGGGQLKFNVYTTAALSQPWTSTTLLTKALTIGAGATVSGTLPFYGSIPSGQSPPPAAGDYQTWFHNTVVGSLVTGTCQSNATNFAGVQISLVVTATVSNACTVTAGAGSKINFGIVAYTATNRSGSSQISVNCPSGTVYRIGLAPSNGSTTGAGVMSGTGANVSKVPYQLRSASAAGPVWGNTATSTSTGNGVSGTGNGASQSISVYATVPSANFAPDIYTDTVTVNVNY